MCQFVPMLDKLPEKSELKKNSVTLKWDPHCHLPVIYAFY